MKLREGPSTADFVHYVNDILRAQFADWPTTKHVARDQFLRMVCPQGGRSAAYL